MLAVFLCCGIPWVDGNNPNVTGVSGGGSFTSTSKNKKSYEVSTRFLCFRLWTDILNLLWCGCSDKCQCPCTSYMLRVKFEQAFSLTRKLKSRHVGTQGAKEHKPLFSFTLHGWKRSRLVRENDKRAWTKCTNRWNNMKNKKVETAEEKFSSWTL